MQITEKYHLPRLEVLKSTHEDTKSEKPRKLNQNRLRLVRFYFNTMGFFFPKFMAWKAYKLFSTPQRKAKHKKIDKWISNAQSLDFQYNNQDIKLYEWSSQAQTTAESPIVLLAHGWESRGTALRMFVPNLVENGFRVVAFDAQAHGDSSGDWNNLPNNARLIAAIIDRLGGKIYAGIGHSFGCPSFIFAQQFINPNIQIERLVFIAVPYSTRRIINHFFRIISAPKRLQKQFLALVERMAKMEIDTLDVAKSADKVKVGRLLLVHDRTDKVTGLDAAEIVLENWKNAHLLITDGYGHFRLAKNPDVVQRITDFISASELTDLQ
jgi:pimeloyl-ACP methyl ester carboxylesterase